MITFDSAAKHYHNVESVSGASSASIASPITLVANAVLGQNGAEAHSSSQLTVERIYESLGLTGSSPKSLTISPDGSRLLFLQAKEEDARQYDIWEHNLVHNTRRLLVDSKALHPNEESRSENELSFRERMRLFDNGIVGYDWSEDGKMILFSLGGLQYLLDFTEAEPTPKAISLSPGAQPTDVQFSSKNRYISFVRDQNLYLFDILNKQELQLTFDGSETISNGTAEFIAQEEMNRYKGYWWSPDEKKIAYVQVDESPVELVKRYELEADGALKITEQRYPFAGSANVDIRVGILDLETKETKWTCLFNDSYLARVDWLQDSSAAALQILRRDQKELDLIFVDANAEWRHILCEKSSTWVTLHDDIHFLKSSFIWSSERSGFRHLYLYDLSGKLIRPLTRGAWAVSRVVSANEEAVYFEGFAASPLEKHLYAVSLDPDSDCSIKQITTSPGWHQISMDKGCQHYIDTFSNVTTPPQVSLHRSDGTLRLLLEENRLSRAHPYYPFASRHSVPEIGTILASDGQTLYYSIKKPVPFDPKVRYPVIVVTYGGPAFRLVKNAWGGSESNYWEQLMTSKGYLIFTLDNRGSCDRGTAFENPIYRRLGEVEVEDQKAGTEFLKTLPFVDGNRIGVFGWSYGGYMTLMTMFKAWETFKAGVAVAPVTEWEQYDTCYTERYLETPKENKEGYAASSLFSHIHERVGKLFLVHGTADDNVLYTNTIKLTKVLQDKAIPFDMMVYPGSKHSIAEKSARIHLFNAITEFFHRHLGWEQKIEKPLAAIAMQELSDKEVEESIDNFFKDSENLKGASVDDAWIMQARLMKGLVRANPVFNEICRFPRLLNILCGCWSSLAVNALSGIHCFSSVLHHFFLRYQQKISQISESTKLIDIYDLCWKCEKEIQFLEHFAVAGLIQDAQLISPEATLSYMKKREDDIAACLLDQLKLGLIEADNSSLSLRNRKYQFKEAPLRDFFAALFLVKCLPENRWGGLESTKLLHSSWSRDFKAAMQTLNNPYENANDFINGMLISSDPGQERILKYIGMLQQ